MHHRANSEDHIFNCFQLAVNTKEFEHFSWEWLSADEDVVASDEGDISDFMSPMKML